MSRYKIMAEYDSKIEETLPNIPERICETDDKMWAEAIVIALKASDFGNAFRFSYVEKND